MEKIIQFFNGAKWAVVNGAFTAEELREIADQIDNPEKRNQDGDKK